MRSGARLHGGSRAASASFDTASHGGTIIGTVQLAFTPPENQRHPRKLQKLLVLPEARRLGIGRALLAAAEQAAADAGRTLLTLDTDAGGMGEALYRAAGWHEVGVIPGYALRARRPALRDTGSSATG